MIKFQTLAIIFVLLVVPISMLLAYYIDGQIDTIAIQNSYDTKLLNSTYDAIIAFQLNTINNEGYSTNAESLRRDINASVKTFTTSLAKNLGIPGANANAVLPYIPAVLYTLYDGYYIYSPIENTTVDKETGDTITTYEHTLKPYVYYTARYYKNGGNTDVVINYSLDNYIVVYGKINGQYDSKAGYLTYWNKYNGITLNGQAADYKTDSYNFSNWVINNLKDIKIEDMVVKVDGNNITTVKSLTDTNNEYYEFKSNGGTKIFDISKTNDPEVKTSAFWDHKNNIIKKSIQSNLNSAINNYTKQSQGMGKTYDYKMPILSATEWDKILSNVSLTTFMQGLNVGMKTYNNYMIVSSTGNNLYVDPEELYFVTANSNELQIEEVDKETGKKVPVNHPTETTSTYYHRINCPLLSEELNSNNYIEGYENIDFKGVYSAIKDTEDNVTGYNYTYTHPAIACYECIVGAKAGGIVFDNEYKDIDSNGVNRGRNYASNNNDNLITFVTEIKTSNGTIKRNVQLQKLREAYYNALFKERYQQIKVSSYVNKAE